MTRKSKRVIENDQNQRLDGSRIFLQSLLCSYLCLLLEIRTLLEAAHKLPEASESAFSHLHHQKVSPYPHIQRSRTTLYLFRLSCCRSLVLGRMEVHICRAASYQLMGSLLHIRHGLCSSEQFLQWRMVTLEEVEGMLN